MRIACAALAGCLLLSTTACRTAGERAEKARDRIEVGMTRDAVAEVLGEPYGWREDEGGYEIWLYAYRPSVGHYLVWGTVDFTEVVVKAALVLGLCVFVAMATKGNLPGNMFDGMAPVNDESEEESRYQRYTFRIGFDPETGRVAFVTTPFPD